MNFVKYFKRRMEQLAHKGALEPDGFEELIQEAISLALAKVWNAGRWTFRNRLYVLDTSTPADFYVLPDDCGPIATPKHEESRVGGTMKYLAKAAFDWRYPKLSAYADGYPQVWTVYTNNRKKYIQFMPRPSISEVQVPYLTTTPESTDHVPDEAVGFLMATIAVYLYKPDTDEYRAAVFAEGQERKALIRSDSPQGEIPHQMFDGSQLQVETGYPWT